MNEQTCQFRFHVANQPHIVREISQIVNKHCLGCAVEHAAGVLFSLERAQFDKQSFFSVQLRFHGSFLCDTLLYSTAVRCSQCPLAFVNAPSDNDLIVFLFKFFLTMKKGGTLFSLGTHEQNYNINPKLNKVHNTPYPPLSLAPFETGLRMCLRMYLMDFKFDSANLVRGNLAAEERGQSPS